jgi:hypothetical protein
LIANAWSHVEVAEPPLTPPSSVDGTFLDAPDALANESISADHDMQDIKQNVICIKYPSENTFAMVRSSVYTISLIDNSQ